ncbi:MAG: hypothetical protein H3C51_12880 [Rubellimicrobium sp.]|nr:hypothetical protein [Rubellimicrobium sp.]
MPLPAPRPGLVIGYEFLYREDAAAGRENAARPHPCAIVLVVGDHPGERVSVVAISHSPPAASAAHDYMRLTAADARQMGLDSGDHWVNLRDINSFDWPGYDLKPIAPGRSYVFGRMGRTAFERLVAALRARRGLKVLDRR